MKKPARPTQPPRPPGFLCPQCGERTRVVVTKTQDAGGKRVYRRRECKNPTCGHRFTTTETPNSRF